MKLVIVHSFVAASVAIVVGQGAFIACTPALHAAADGSYAAQLSACVDQAKTLAESKSCRARVDQAWGVEGGAP
jgi:hypothetical protein